MPDNDKIIEQQLHALLTGMGDAGGQILELKEQIGSLRSEYESAREAAKTGSPSDKAAFAMYQTALASGLPGITRGTLSAISAFQQQPPDAIVGSAAIMDICSSLASALGGLSTAGGPPGALLGALFSMVSMILNFFAPKPPSLISQIEKLMRDLEAEKKKSEIEAAGEAVRVYAEGCDAFMKPLQNGDIQDPRLLATELTRFNLVEGNTVAAIRTVRGWLLTDGNQGLDGWPEVLNLQCETYMHLMLAVTRQNLYAHDAQRIKKYVGMPPDPIKAGEWAQLQLQVQVKLQNLLTNNMLTSEFMKKVLPVARKRGVYIIAFSGDKIYVATGPRAFVDNEFGGIFNHCRRMSVTRPWGGVDGPAAQYDLWVLDSGYGRFAYHSRLDSRTRKLTIIKETDDTSEYVDGRNANVNTLFSDWWSVPTAVNTFTIYGTRDYAQGGALEAYTWKRDTGAFDRIDWRPVTGPKMIQIRVASALTTLPDDPDRDAMPESLLKDGSILYGTLEGSKEIFVWVGNKGYLVPIPMSSYNGIAVDSTFLWMYGKDGFACASHASVMSRINQPGSMPLWLGPPDSNLARVLDLSSCEDGTLLVSSLDPDRLATGVYHVDYTSRQGAGKMLSIEKWEDLVGGPRSAQVQKLPVFGWPLIKRLTDAVSQTANVVVKS